MKQLFFKHIKSLGAIALFLAAGMPDIVKADYIYTYTGNVFQANYEVITATEPGEFYTVNTPFQTSINAVIRTATLFTPGANIDDVISMTFTAAFVYDTTTQVTYPGPPPNPSDYNPQVTGYLDIASVDANGLPTAWNVIIDQYVFLGGRGHNVNMATSTFSNSITGYDEPFVTFGGALANNPGTWQVALSPVPEPETYGLFLIGLGMIGYLGRRRYPKNC
jgi:hypothetical protein